MPQHAFRREDYQGLAPSPPRLPPQHMEILRRRGRLADLYVFFSGELQEPLDARARVLRALALKAVRQKQDDARRQIPFVLARADELIDDHLRAVDEVAKLRLPQHQRFGIVPAEPVLEAETSRFRERGIVDLTEGLARRLSRHGAQWNIGLLGLRVDQHRMALVERSALRVLPGQTKRRPFL